MTLRATIEIIPHGNENNKRNIYRLNISNVGLVRNEGFGNEICRYRVEVQAAIFKSPILNNMDEEKEWETIDIDWIEEHNRRDGAINLVAKAANLVWEKT